MKTRKQLFLSAVMASSVFYGAMGQKTIGTIIKPNFSCILPVDQDDFSNPSTWTIVDAPVNNGNGSVVVTGGTASELLFSNAEGTSTCATQPGAANNREMRTYRVLSTMLSNNSWRAECQFRIINGNSPTQMLMGFTSNSQDPEDTKPSTQAWVCGANNTDYNTIVPTNVDGIFASLICFGADQSPHNYTDSPFPGSYNASMPLYQGNALGWRIFGHAKCGAKVISNQESYYPANIYQAEGTNPPAPDLNWSRGILLPALNTDYYLRLERLNNGSCRISVFSDAAMTINVPGSPQCFEIDPAIANLDYIQNAASTTGSCFRSLYGYIKNFQVFNNCPGIPNLTITPSSTTICPGGSVTMQATSGFINYTWSPAVNVLHTNPGGTTAQATPTVTTTYTVTADYPSATDNDGYCPFQTTITITVVPGQPVDPSFALSGSMPATGTNFTATATPTMSNSTVTGLGAGYSYAWNVDMVDATTGALYCSVADPINWHNTLTSNTFPGYSSNSSASTNGCSDNTSITTGSGSFYDGFKYRITHTITSPCGVFTDVKSITLCQSCRSTDGNAVFTVVDETAAGNRVIGDPNAVAPIAQMDDIKIFPNPSNGIFNVVLDNAGTGSIEVYDVVGRNVKSIPLNSNNTNYSLDLSNSPKGIYILNMMYNNHKYTQKLIVQ